jgi:hypothetical protein
VATAHETDERLRHRPDSSKLRERLCADLLSLDKRFSQVRSRNPKGGPDQGRDMEALFEGRALAFGAVGFIDGANDSASHRRQIKKKFRDDLESALRHQADLEVFIFFTNVALTPADQDEVRNFAIGLKRRLVVELFTREQIRATLDTPMGFGLRLGYLDIEMSKSEQASFFAAFGKEIQATIARKFTDLDRSMARLEFLADKPSPLTWLQATFRLKRPCTPSDLGAFRILMEFRRRGSRGDEPQFSMATEDASMDTADGRTHAIRMYVGTRQHSIHNLKDPLREKRVLHLPVGCELPPDPPIRTLAHMDQHEINVWVSKPLHARIASITLTANVYEIAELTSAHMYFEEVDGPPWWPDTKWWPDLTSTAKNLQWVVISRATHLPFPDYQPNIPWLIDYYRHMPLRMLT